MNKISRKIKLLSLILFLTVIPFNLSAQTNPNADVESRVRQFFADKPVMIDIAYCETKFKQYASDGSPYFDGSRTYVGVYQISYELHKPKALSFGVDLTTLEGNLAYARYLYDTSGTNPWKGCLPKTSATSSTPVIPTPQVTTPAVLGQITSNFRMGMNNPQIKLIQQILNRSGFQIAALGPGSSGNETNYFGSLTREAVRKFQCAKGIVCDGSEATTGYGRVGPTTRRFLNAIIGL